MPWQHHKKHERSAASTPAAEATPAGGGPETKKKKRRHPILKSSVLIICLALIYVIYGTIGPYIGNRDVDQIRRDRFSTAGFYAPENSSSNDRVRILSTRNESEMMLLNVIDSATSLIRVAMKDTPTRTQDELLIGALLAAADRGVSIELLADGSDPIQTKRLYHPLLRSDKVRVRSFRPIETFLPWTYHSRMSDRFLIADDKLAWFSEATPARSVTGSSDDPSHSDWDVLVFNGAYNSPDTADSVLSQLTNYFTALWSSNYSVDLPSAQTDSDEVMKTESKRLINQWEVKREQERQLQSNFSNYQQMTTPVDHISLIKNPVNSLNKEPYLRFQLDKLMSEAKDRVIIQTPYILLSADMYKKMTALSGTVPSSRLLTCSFNCNGNYFQMADYRVNRKDVINTGIQISEYQGHSAFLPKALLIDDELTILGSYDWSQAGTYLNTQSMLVIQSKEINKKVTELNGALQKEALVVRPNGDYSLANDVKPLASGAGKGTLRYLSGLFIQFFRTLF